jgi:hypothetical protein
VLDVLLTTLTLALKSLYASRSCLALSASGGGAVVLHDVQSLYERGQRISYLMLLQQYSLRFGNERHADFEQSQIVDPSFPRRSD